MHHGQARVHVGLLRRHEAEVLDARQPDVLDDEVQLREVGRRVVDVGDVERVLVQRPDRRALVDVDVLDAELLAPSPGTGSASGSFSVQPREPSRHSAV